MAHSYPVLLAASAIASVSSAGAQSATLTSGTADVSAIGLLSNFTTPFLQEAVDISGGPNSITRMYDVPDPTGPVYQSSILSEGDASGLTWSGSGTTSMSLPDGVNATPIDPDFGTFLTSSARQVMLFTATRPIDILLSYEASYTADGVPDALVGAGFRVILREAGSAPGLTTFLRDDLEIVPGANSLSQTGTSISLAPGDYSLLFVGSVTVGQGQGYQSQEMSFSWNAIIVPTPATSALVGLAGLAATRRRR